MRIKKQKKDRILWQFIFMGIAFCCMSMLFLQLSYLGPRATKRKIAKWDSVPCRIEKSEVKQIRLDRFEFSATYSYDVNGRRFKSSVVDPPKSKAYFFNSVRHRLPLLEKYVPGSEHVCRVNPDDSRVAVMAVNVENSEKSFVSIALLCGLCVFFLVGISMISCAFPAFRRLKAEGFKSFAICIIGILFGLIFACIGIGESFARYKHYIPVNEYISTPAKVLYSGITSHTSSGSKGHRSTTYATVVGYEYMVDGKRYENDAFSFSKLRTGNHDLHRRQAERYRKGDEITILRSPDDPFDTVIEANAGALPLNLVMLLFALVGIAITVGSIVFYIRSFNRRARAGSVSVFFNKPLHRSFADVIMLGFFTLFWNLLGWGGALALTDGFDTAHISGAWFVLIFPLIGLGLIFKFIDMVIRKIRGPHFNLFITCDGWKPEARVSVTYEQIGDGDIEAFKVKLEQILKVDNFAAGRSSRQHGQPVPTRTQQVYEAASIPRSGSFSFTVPLSFTMEDVNSCRLELAYHTASQLKDNKDIYSFDFTI